MRCVTLGEVHPTVRRLLIVTYIAMVIQGLAFFRNEDYYNFAPLLAAQVATVGPLLFFAVRSLSMRWTALYLSQMSLAYGAVMFVIRDPSVWGYILLESDVMNGLAVALVGVGACALGSLWQTRKKSGLPHAREKISFGPLWGSWRWWLASYAGTIWIDHFWALGSAIGFLGQLIRSWPLIAILALDVLGRTGHAPAKMTRIVWWGLVPLRMILHLGTGFAGFVFNEGVVLLFYLTMRRLIRIRVWGIVLACLAFVLVVMSRTYVRNELWTKGDGPTTRVEVAAVVATSLANQLSVTSFMEGVGDFARDRVGHYVLVAHTLVVSETPERVPYLKGESFYQFLWLFVPRTVYPDKPSEAWGQTFGHLYGLLDPRDYYTSFNFPQLTEFYANGGIWLVLLMMGALGWIIHRVASWAERLDRNSADILWVVLPTAFGMLNQAFSNLTIAMNAAVYYALALTVPTLLKVSLSKHSRREHASPLR